MYTLKTNKNGQVDILMKANNDLVKNVVSLETAEVMLNAAHKKEVTDEFADHQLCLDGVYYLPIETIPAEELKEVPQKPKSTTRKK